MRDEFDMDMSGIIDAHAESMIGEDDTYGEVRARVSRSYRPDRFFDEEDDTSLFDTFDE